MTLEPNEREYMKVPLKDALLSNRKLLYKIFLTHLSSQ